MEYNSTTLSSFLLFNKEIAYTPNIVLYPIKMKDIVSFQHYLPSIILRKDSIFTEKKLIKMSYLQFIKYANNNSELAEQYELPELPFYYNYILQLLFLACGEETKITYNPSTLSFSVNDEEVTDSMFDDIRRILIIQNDVDYDIDEFMNIDTVNALEKAKEFDMKKNKEKANIEDYIDSLVVGLQVTEDYVSNLTIRKFWRYIKRINKHETYQSYCSGKMTGLVTFKEPLAHWMTTLEVEDKYQNQKTDESELRSKIG